MGYTVRRANFEDLPRIEEIYAYARRFMEQTGNPTQWGKHHPPHACLVEDIEKQFLYVLTDEKGIHGVFYFVIAPDPTYAEIRDGAWRHDGPYGTIHRIASDGSGGILAAAVRFCAEKIDNIRIDTHQDNFVMQKAVAKLGFVRSGIIFTDDGSPRIAYELEQ